MLHIEDQEIESGIVLLRLQGRIVVSSGPAEFTARAKAAIDGGAKALLFELSGVTHLDSTGIGCFISCMNMAAPAGARVLMVGAGPTLREAFRVTRLDSVFPFYDSVPAAMEGLRNSA